MQALLRVLIVSFTITLGALPAIADQALDPPSVMLAEVYDPQAPLDLDAYWISEKLDGVRGYWDGHRLLTRGGHTIHAPAWFTANWPAEPLDGELWAGRGRFEFASATTRAETPDDAAWRQMHYEIFDLPAHDGPFDVRLAAMRQLLPTIASPWLQMIAQYKLHSRVALQHKLDEVVAAGGEGLMLHRGSALYRGGRSDDLLKFKPYDDAEAVVIGYVPGKGKYAGMMGALKVRSADGREFRIGSGFSDAQRRDPPPIGSQITYVYNGLTKNGLPRFARFLRIREELP